MIDKNNFLLDFKEIEYYDSSFHYYKKAWLHQKLGGEYSLIFTIAVAEEDFTCITGEKIKKEDSYMELFPVKNIFIKGIKNENNFS